MESTITYNGKTRVFDKNLPETKKDLLVHEVGHAIVASVLGYEVRVETDIENQKYWVRKIGGNPKDNRTALEDHLTICLGGEVAEFLCDRVTVGFMQDRADVFNIMKELYRLDGKNFPYEKIFELPEREYQLYLDHCKKILEDVGKDIIENTADHLLEQLLEMEKEQR